ncbi:MAG: glycosyltransferase [Microgenomates group bacterium]
MIGWEYPPHNSGGLGVACDGLTQSLAHSGTNIQFTLPYHSQSSVSHMKVLDCVDPSWLIQNGDTLDMPPFLAYDQAIPIQNSIKSSEMDMDVLRSLPQSELERKVYQYADMVATEGTHDSSSYDVIHAHDWMAYPAGMKLKQKTGKPLITHVHSTEYDRSALHKGSEFITKTEYEGMQMANIVVAVSQYTKKLLIDRYKIPASKIEVVHNGVAPLRYPPDPGNHHFASDRPVVVYMGRLTIQKGVQYFIHLAKAVLERNPETLFIVAGSGDMYHELLFTTAREQLSASVLFSGFVRGKQQEKLLDRADVFVMPSISEPFGLVALEAAQRHTPVVISKNAGVSEVLPGGISVDFWDINKMGAVISHLINDRDHHSQIIKNQLRDLQTATWDVAANRMRAVYRRAIVGK